MSDLQVSVVFHDDQNVEKTVTFDGLSWQFNGASLFPRQMRFVNALNLLVEEFVKRSRAQHEKTA